MENIKENIKYLQAKKEELKSIKREIDEKRTAFEKDIEEKRKKFEESLEPLKESSNKASEEFYLLAGNKVSVSLEDLINELSSLTGISILNMGIEIETNVEYWGKYNLRRILELMNSSNQNLNCTDNYNKNNFWEITLFADKNTNSREKTQVFCYDMSFKLNLEELQSDGKPLLEHCSVKVHYDDMQVKYYTNLVIDKNIGSLNCNLSLNDLVKAEITEGYCGRWYPTDLLTQAVINCVERQKEEKQHSKKNEPLFQEKANYYKEKFREIAIAKNAADDCVIDSKEFSKISCISGCLIKGVTFVIYSTDDKCNIYDKQFTLDPASAYLLLANRLGILLNEEDIIEFKKYEPNLKFAENQKAKKLSLFRK